jgi:PAS domain S-box-containing protein
MTQSSRDHRTKAELLEEIGQLRARLDDAEQTLDAIRTGDVDALVVAGPQGDQVFSLTGAERTYRLIIETMNEAALTVDLAGTILFCNQRFADLVKSPIAEIIGRKLTAFVARAQQAPLQQLLAEALAGPVQRSLTLRASGGAAVSVQIAASPLVELGNTSICLVASDLTELETQADSIRVLLEHKQALEESKAELQAANAALLQSRLAALNVSEDALAARQRAEELSTYLQREVTERLHAEEKLSKVNEGLEKRVSERTQELASYIEKLQLEISDRKKAEESVQRLNQLHTLLSETNQAIVRTRDRDTLFNDFCRIAVQTGGFKLAWVGLIDEETGELKVVASAGATGYLEDLRIPVNEEPAGLGPTGLSIRDGSYFICNDFLGSPITRPWHEKGKTHGVRASASIAFKQEGRVVGALTLYADQKDFFDQLQVELLRQMGADVSCALDIIVREARRQEAEQSLKAETSERLRAEKEVRTLNIELEQRVIERTAQLQLEVAERERAEEQIKASLAEKEVMLREIHHRVKNNLQVISSLINLQAASLTDERMREEFNDVRDRVRSMALIHEKLYQTNDLARLNFADYAASLLNSLWRSHGALAAKVRLNLELAPVVLSIEAAVPCGLILNELVVNALKHAFPNGGGGEVTVGMEHNPSADTVCLRVHDNGVGLPADMDWRQSSSLGLRLVRILAGQLRGTVETGTGPGAEFHLTFPLNELHA